MQNTSTNPVIPFLESLPEGIRNLQAADAGWMVQALRDDLTHSEVPQLLALRVASKLGSTKYITPQGLCERLAGVLGILYEHEDTQVDEADADFVRWVECLHAQGTHKDEKKAMTWDLPTLPLPVDWEEVQNRAGDLLDPACRRRVLQGIPDYPDLKKPATNNTAIRIPYDNVLRNWDHQLRDLQRTLATLHLTLLQDRRLEDYDLPDGSRQLQNAFAISSGIRKGIEQHRLKQIDPKLVPEKANEEHLVKKEDLSLLDKRQRVLRLRSGFKGGKGYANPYPIPFRPFNGSKGKGKGKGGKGKGLRAIFSAKPPSPAQP